MAITQVATATFLTDATLLVRDNLQANITDPLVSTRPSTEKFVMTAYPQRKVTYPVITVIEKSFPFGEAMGAQSLTHEVPIVLELRIWARNVIERTKLTQQCLNQLRGVQVSLTIPGGLHDFKVLSVVPVDEPGDAGIHSFVVGIQYTFILGP